MSDEPKIDLRGTRPIDADDYGGDEPMDPAYDDQPGGDENASGVADEQQKTLEAVHERQREVYDSEPAVAAHHGEQGDRGADR